MHYLSLSFIVLSLLANPPQSEPKTITSAEAKVHVGESVKVCGVVRGVYEPQRSQRNPSFLNFDKPYPQTEFTAVIWRQDRAAFGDLRGTVGKKACVTGQVKEYRGRAQMVLTRGEQLSVATKVQRE